MSFFILASVLGVPLSWGGSALVWVGFELLLESYKVGRSQRRAEWFVRWATEIAATPIVHMKTFEERLGRIMFVADRLEHERPFLGPLYNFLPLHPRNLVRRVPSHATFILEFVAQHLEESQRLQRVPGKIWDCAES